MTTPDNASDSGYFLRYNTPSGPLSLSRHAQESLAGGIPRYEVREQLNRILLSRHFKKAKKKSRFLEFMCEQALSGKAEDVNEYTIAVDIYERAADFNPQEDSIVRVQAHEIRKSLVAFYEEEGLNDRVRIGLPVGGYVPVFTWINGASKPAVPQAETAAEPSPVVRRPYAWLAIAAAACCALAGGWLIRGLMPWGAPSRAETGIPGSAAWFWRPFLSPATSPLVVLPVHPMLRLAHGGDSPAIRSRGYLIDKETLPEFRDTIHFRELPDFRFVSTITDFTGVGEALGLLTLSEFLGGAGQRIRAKAGRLVDYGTVKSGNTILLGGNQSWSGRVFVYKDGFEFHNGVISNKKPLPGEQDVYKPEFDPVTGNLSRDYGLVLMLPNERRDQRVLLLYGIYTQGTQAAIEYVTNVERLAELRKALAGRSVDHKSVPNYFQVLLSTSVENYVPVKVSLVSTRTIPQ